MTKLGSNAMSEYLVSLVGCPHTLTFRRSFLPKIGEELWCQRCGEYRRAREHVGMYRSRCAWRGCKYSRTHGAAQRSAERSAQKHANEHPGHAVAVYLGSERVSLHGIAPEQLELPELLA